MKANYFLLLAGILWTQVSYADDVRRPDLRFLSNQLIDAAPSFADFDDFMATVELDDDWEDLTEEYQERQERIDLLEKSALQSLGKGKKFKAQDELMNLLYDQIAFLRLRAQYDYYQDYRMWLVDEIKEKPVLDFVKKEAVILQALENARKMAASFKELQGEYTSYLLIRMLARTGNENYEYYYNRFVRNYADSEYLSRINHIVGEYLTTKGDFKAAGEKFKLALADKKSPIRPYTSYKLAWSMIQQADKEKKPKTKNQFKKKADVAFKLTFKLLEDWDEHEPVYDLKKEAARDALWFWALGGRSEKEIKTFLDDVDQEKLLPQFYYFQGLAAAKQKDAKKLNASFRKLRAYDKESEYIPDYFLKQIQLAYQLGQVVTVNQTYQAFAGSFHEENDWYDEWEGEKDYMKYVLKRLAVSLRIDAIDLHQTQLQKRQQAAEAKNKKAFDIATKNLDAVMELYDLYQKTFPKSEFRDDIVYNHSNLLYELGRLKESANLFSLLGKKKDSKYQQEAAYNAVMAAYAADQKKPQPKLPEPGTAKKPIPVSDSKKLLIQKIDFFAKTFPLAKEVPQTTYTAAQIFYDHGHYKHAFDRFDKIVKKAPKTEEGEIALRTILGHYWEKQDWKMVVKLTKKYLVTPAVISSGHEPFLRETLKQAQGQLSVSQK
ncbi:MAG: hypothetical protein HRU19_19625 [Pseudobacteriovorax sp.]|nr:hypothetical protein [Pseudobacteriovorax sp.]